MISEEEYEALSGRSLLSRYVDETAPKFNPYVMNGYATYVMPRALEYLYKVVKSAISGFEDLELTDVAFATPEEEIRNQKNKANRYTFDLARNSIRLVRFELKYKGEPLPPKYVYIPYLQEAATLYLSDALYHVTPILGDKVITKTPNGLFVRLIRDKILVNKFVHVIVMNDEKISANVMWAQIYRNENTSKKSQSVPKTTLMHYMMAEYGLTGFFKRFFGFEPIVINSYTNLNGADWKHGSYEKLLETHHVFESTGRAPRVFANVPNYIPPDIKILIPKNCLNVDVRDAIGSVIYILELSWLIFRSSASMNDPLAIVNNKEAWKLSLGKFITFGKAYSNDKIYSVVSEHFKSLKSYIDEMIRDKLNEIGFSCSNFYELIGELLARYSKLSEDPIINSSKYLEVIYYLLYPITEAFYRFSFALNKSNRELNRKMVIEALNKTVKAGAIFKLTKSQSKNICEPISCSNDHMYFKFTSKIVEQEGFIPKTSKQRRQVVDETKHIKIRHIQIGSILYLMKANPDPLTRINPFVKIDVRTGSILFDEEDDEYDRLLTPLFVNTQPMSEEAMAVHRIAEEEEEIDID
jgi:hypothetical protein